MKMTKIFKKNPKKDIINGYVYVKNNILKIIIDM